MTSGAVGLSPRSSYSASRHPLTPIVHALPISTSAAGTYRRDFETLNPGTHPGTGTRHCSRFSYSEANAADFMAMGWTYSPLLCLTALLALPQLPHAYLVTAEDRKGGGGVITSKGKLQISQQLCERANVPYFLSCMPLSDSNHLSFQVFGNHFLFVCDVC